MKTKKAILLTLALLLAMIGAAWSQRSASSNIPIPLPCGNSNTNATRDCTYSNTVRRWAPVMWNANASQWEIDYDTWANINATSNAVVPAGYYGNSSTNSMWNSANVAANYAVNANSWANKPAPRKKKPRPKQ